MGFEFMPARYAAMPSSANGFSSIPPNSPRMAPEQNNLEQLPRPEPGLGPMCDRFREAVADDTDDEVQLAAFAFRQMVQTLLHSVQCRCV